jgi:hypothetical protein
MHSEIDNYFIYKMGCSNSKADEPVAIQPPPPARPEFDSYASQKFDFTLETQEKLKAIARFSLGMESSLDLLQLTLGFRFEDYSKLSMEWEKRRLMIKSFNGPIIILATGLDQNDKFGGCALYMNNEVFKWNKSKTY